MPEKKAKDEHIVYIDSKDMFLKRALEKLLNEKDIKKSQHQQLKRACETALSSIAIDVQTSQTNESSILPSTDQQSLNAEKYFLPFELACASNHPRMVDTALDCLQKLLLHGHLIGSAADPIDPSKLLIDRIVSTICMCFRGVQTEEQALLTIMTSQVIEIHQRSVLQIVKTCFNIYLTSRSKINEATAQGSLSQMLNGIFSKMEQKMALLTERRKQYQEESTTSTNIENENVPTVVKEMLDELVEQICYDEATQGNENAFLSTNEIIEDTHSTPDEFHNTISRNTIDSQSTGDPVFIKNTTSNSLSDDELSTDNCFKNAYYVFRALCKLSDRDIKDKTNTDPKTNLDLKSRIFSLRLILQILQTSGPIFRSSEDFLYVIKTYLCVSLSRNGVSSIAELFEMALFNFVELIDKFKSYLKIQIEKTFASDFNDVSVRGSVEVMLEIGVKGNGIVELGQIEGDSCVLFREIFLTILETSTSSFRHKWLVIQTLAKISADAQIIVDLFINYDCSLRSVNIFERLVIVLSRAAQGRQAEELGCSPTEEHNLRMKGLECLVSILRCMVEWSKDLYVNPHLQSNLGPDSKPLHDNGYDQDSGRSSSGYFANGIRRADSSGSINSSHSNGGLSSEPSKNVLDFEIVRQRKELLEKGIDLFNQNPKKGLEYLSEKNLLNNEPADIAQFLHSYHDVLDKTLIGDCLGHEDNHYKQVMYAYVDQIDFTKMEFLVALRKFLSGFRLPGEAQKIDRLMEKFAARFCECNAHLEIFASADTAYVLAYSVIMLTTDLHSKNVKNKMTKEQYIKMNRGINESRDLPEEFLSKIYDEIESEEIKLKVTTLRRGANAVNAGGTKENVTSDKQRELLFYMQMKDVECVARDLMSNAGSSTEEFATAKHLEHVRPMFQKAWSPCLAAFSVGLQDSDHIDLAHLCLTGINYSIRIACIFHMKLELNAFIQALSRFTLLMTTSQVMEIKPKNVECLKTLILVAQTDGNYLEEAWYDILKCISQLELAQLFGINASKGKLNVSNHHSYPNLQANNSYTFSSPFDNLFYSEKGQLSKRMQTIQDQIHETSSQNIVVSVDRIFSGSARLDGDAIVAFVRSLCHVSMDELHSNPPRMFSLLKLVEISYYNMGRIRLQWSRIWEFVGDHFNKVACNPLQDVAFFAVDSLRQLTMKFLEKGEFPNFRFQKEFLKPFEVIMKKNSSSTIRDMVVRCVTHFVDSQAKNIRSGWKNIFSVFQMAAADTDPQIVELAFQTCSHIVVVVFDRQFASVLDSFQDAVKCLSEFACNASFPDTSMEAIRLIRQCAKYAAEKPQFFHDHAAEDLINVPEEDRVWVKGWFPVLFELSCVINRCKLDVRTRALTVMFEIMKTYGETYSQNWWVELFNVVFRIFDNMKLPDTQIEKIEWMTTTCNHALYAIVDVFTQFYDEIPPRLIDNLYCQLKWCVNQDNEILAKSGTNCFENFVITCGQRFTPHIWERTCACILEIFRSTLPEILMTWRHDAESSGTIAINDTSLPDRTDSSFDYSIVESASSQHNRMVQAGNTASLNSSISDQQEFNLSNRLSPTNSIERSKTQSDFHIFQILTIKCIVQLELIQTIDDIVFYPSTSKKEDLQNIAIAQKLTWFQTKALANVPSGQQALTYFANSDDFRDDHGMYNSMGLDQLLLLVDCLIESHMFARAFNSNHEQRNLLWKAGYRGKAKPNLLTQETHSIACAFRILFRLFSDPKRSDSMDTLKRRILKLTHGSLEYYVTLQSESHRDAWTSVLILIFTKFLKLNEDQFKYFSGDIYSIVAETVVFDLKSELRYILREFLLRVGSVFNVTSELIGSN
ncbi:unnamed protein product [Rotaria socialis]|uniref:SEC7 domain-containing protein n=1 Tax=Rotaria socialis TaxID=392032 RepID=A0A821L4R1_9BILA|nr:unnamed protein product [Rotaria socialis]CAF4745536.1 unnamed protein product [Rotaria socialis]